MLLVVGCKSTPAVHVKNATPATMPAGWEPIEDREDGVSVGAPSGWKVGTANSIDVMSVAGGMGGDNQSMSDPNNPFGKELANMQAQDSAEEAMALNKLREKGIIISVIDKGSRAIPGEERTRFWVQVTKGTGNMTWDAAMETEKHKLVGDSTPKKVSLPIGDAQRYDSEVTTIGGDKVNRITYLVIDGPNTYELKFISTNNPTAITSIADQVAETWRIRPGKDQ